MDASKRGGGLPALRWKGKAVWVRQGTRGVWTQGYVPILPPRRTEAHLLSGESFCVHLSEHSNIYSLPAYSRSLISKSLQKTTYSMTDVIQKEKLGAWGCLVTQQIGRSTWSRLPHFPFPAEENSPDRAEIPSEGINLSPNLLPHTLAASLQDRLHDAVSNISKVSKYEEGKALCCDSGCPLHFETVWLHFSLSGKPTKRRLL